MLWLGREAPLVPGLVSVSSEYLDMWCLKWGAVLKSHIWKMEEGGSSQPCAL